MSNNENYVYIEYDEKTNSDKYFIGGIHEFSIQFNKNTNGYIREHLEDFIRDEDNILKLNWEGFNTLITNDFVKHLTSQNEFLIKSNRNLKERIELLEELKNDKFFYAMYALKTARERSAMVFSAATSLKLAVNSSGSAIFPLYITVRM